MSLDCIDNFASWIALKTSQHLEPGTEPFTPEQEFGQMTLSDYDSNEDADYAPSDSDVSSDELEYDSGASVSSASEAVESDGEGLAAEE